MSGLQQSGAAAAAKALPPMIPFGVGEDRHFELALELQQRPTPFESMALVDDDLIFAAALASGVEPQDVAHHLPPTNLSATGYQIRYAGTPHCLGWAHHVAYRMA